MRRIARFGCRFPGVTLRAAAAFALSLAVADNARARDLEQQRPYTHDLDQERSARHLVHRSHHAHAIKAPDGRTSHLTGRGYRNTSRRARVVPAKPAAAARRDFPNDYVLHGARF